MHIMSCTKEEIERKRLTALKMRKSKILPHLQEVQPSHVFPSSSPKLSWPSNSCGQGSNASYTHKELCKTSNSFHPYKKDYAVSSSSTTAKVVTGNMYLVSEDRFEVKLSEFCTPLIDIFKTVPSRCYDSKTRLWNFKLHDYEYLLNKISPLRPDVVLGQLPSYVLKILREKTLHPNSVDLSMIDPVLRNKLMDFQEEGVRFGIAHNGRCMIADDMGLGKTFQALAITSFYKSDWPLLIVTTSSMRETWQQKIAELLPGVPLLSVVMLNSARDVATASEPHVQVAIASYKMSTHLHQLKHKRFGVVVIDESHYLKSHKAQCTVALTKVTKWARRVVLLSGTPALSRPAELYTQLAIIEPAIFPGFTEYGKRYCDGKLTNFGWDMSGQSNLAELQILLQRRFLIRRTKEQVLPSVQDKVRESVQLADVLLGVSQEEQQGLSRMAQRLAASKSGERHSALLTFFSETAKIKTSAVCKYIREVVRTDQRKFLVFAHHKQVIDAVCETLDSLRISYISIVGGTRTDTRGTLVDKFQHNESCRVAVLSITAANSGLTLTAAQLVLFAELHWNPGILTQAESRAHRIGQRGSVCARYLLARGTADDFMWPMLQNKLNVLNEVGLSVDNFNNTKHTVQENSNSITKYLSPCSKTTNNLIPVTNIRKSELTSSLADPSMRCERVEVCRESDMLDIEESFLEDDEGDDLLATLDI